jgi:hypothetical protein
MPLQLLLFWDMPLQFMKLDICHRSSTKRQNWMANFQYRSQLQWQVSISLWIAMASFHVWLNCNDKFPIRWFLMADLQSLKIVMAYFQLTHCLRCVYHVFIKKKRKSYNKLSLEVQETKFRGTWRWNLCHVWYKCLWDNWPSLLW